jgi:hypothetical protein
VPKTAPTVSVGVYVHVVGDRYVGEPKSRSLGEGLRELRFHLDGNAVRVPYWLAPGRRIVLLTVFRKTRMREEAEVKRAKQAKALCEAEHDPAHEEFTRDFREEL